MSSSRESKGKEDRRRRTLTVTEKEGKTQERSCIATTNEPSWNGPPKSRETWRRNAVASSSADDATSSSTTSMAMAMATTRRGATPGWLFALIIPRHPSNFSPQSDPIFRFLWRVLFFSLPYFLKASSFSYKILFEFSSWLTIERTFSCVFLPFSISYSLFLTNSFFPPVFVFFSSSFFFAGVWNLIFLRFSCFPSHPSHAWLEFEQDQRNKIFWIPGEQKRKFLRWVGWHAISSVFQCFHNATTNDRETHYKMQSATSLPSLSLPIVEDT